MIAIVMMIGVPLLGACDEGDGGDDQDTSMDTMDDLVDTADDTMDDMELDVPLDVPLDLPPDLDEDGAEDAMDEDGTDVAMDMTGDELLTPDGEEDPLPAYLDDLRSVEDGWLDPELLIQGAYLSYVVPFVPPEADPPISHPGNGFFIQEETAGPAIFVSTGDTDASTLVSRGDEVDLVVSETDSFHGFRRVTTYRDLTAVSSDNDISSLVQDLSADGTVDEDMESEIVSITGAELGAGTAEVFPMTFGTASSTDLAFMQDTTALAPCEGMTFDIVAVAAEYDGSYRIVSFRDTDLSSVDSSGCL